MQGTIDAAIGQDFETDRRLRGQLDTEFDSVRAAFAELHGLVGAAWSEAAAQGGREGQQAPGAQGAVPLRIP